MRRPYPRLLCRHLARYDFRGGRRRRMASDQPTGPAVEAIDAIVIGKLGRPSDQEAVADLLHEFLLRPAVAIAAEWNLIPLLGLVIVANLREGLTLPDVLHAVGEDITDIRHLETVEAADGYRAVVMDRHGLVDRGTRHALCRGLHVGIGAVLEDQADANAVDNAGPARDECLFFVC